MIPLVLVCGVAGAGKDTLSEMICQGSPGAVQLAFADKLKRYVNGIWPQVTPEMLWGPSENRNRVVGTGNFWGWDVDPKDGCDKFLKATELEHKKEEAYLIFADIANRIEDIDKYRHNRKNSGVTPRMLLQLMGTEFGRALKKNIWADIAINNAKKLLGGGHSYTKEGGVLESLDKSAGMVVISDGRFASEIIEVKAAGGWVVKVERDANLSKAALKAGNSGHVSELELDTVPAHFFNYIVKNNGTLAELRNKANWLVDQICKQPVII